MPPQAAYPAQLEAMLRARGYQGQVTNAGINGDTTSHMLARLSAAVPPGTRVVVLQPGGNDLRQGINPAERQGDVQQIVAQLKGRGIQVIVLGNQMLHAIPSQDRQPDGQHLTPDGYRLVASWLFPQVAQALGLPTG